MLRWGRTNRATYWLSLGVVLVLYIALRQLSSRQIGLSEAVLAVVAIPRLHDIGLSAWWAAGAFLAEIAIAIGLFSTLPPENALISMGIFTLLVAGLLIWLGSKPGQPFANRFGEPPAPGLSFGRYIRTTEPEPDAVTNDSRFNS